MTWRTSEGERWLFGHEAILVRESLASMVDQISDNIGYGDEEPLWNFEVELFDEVTPTQQLVLATAVAEHLLTATNETLELTAINEATVYVVFRNVAVQIAIEVDVESDREPDDGFWKFFWRRLTLAAYHECFADEDPWTVPESEQSTNMEEWDSIVESLADQILWDRDFEMAGNFLDTEPAKAVVMKQVMGIEADYYSTVAPDLGPSEVEAMLTRVRKITHQKPR